MPKDYRAKNEAKAQARAQTCQTVKVWPQRAGRVFVRRRTGLEAAETALERERSLMKASRAQKSVSKAPIVNTITIDVNDDSDEDLFESPDSCADSDYDDMEQEQLKKLSEQTVNTCEQAIGQPFRASDYDTADFASGTSAGTATDAAANSAVDVAAKPAANAAVNAAPDAAADTAADIATGVSPDAVADAAANGASVSDTKPRNVPSSYVPDPNDPEYDELHAIAAAVSSKE